jgi:hypothetical protein
LATTKSTKSWILNEFKEFNCGDGRLDNRFVTVASDALENPSARINHASSDWAAAKGAYRFFNNPKVDKAEMFRCHKENTIDRMKKLKVVLAIQDSSYLDFSRHTKLKGKGPIGTRQQDLTGYVMHSTLAASPEGFPLGLLTHDLWAREEIRENRKVKDTLPLEEKESYKWVKALEDVHALKSEDIEIINIADREADFYEYLEIVERLNEKIIIRARFDRTVKEEQNEVDDDSEKDKKSMWDFMQEQPVRFKESVEVSRNHIHVGGKNKRELKECRVAEVEVKVGQVTFNPPSKGKKQIPLMYNLVFIKEVNAPDGTIPLEWMLIANLSISHAEDISKIIKYYRTRWVIEEYHKILKTGCAIENCLLEDTEAMFRYITLFSIIAWRLFWITRLQRINPEAPCTQGIADVEWKALYCYLHRTKTPQSEVPTIREAVIWIARLGGFLARKGDGDPGIITVWRGWTRLQDIVDIYQLFTVVPEEQNGH